MVPHMCAPTGFSVGGVPAPVTDLGPHPVPDAIDADDWALRVTGAVDRSLRLSATDLESFPLETVTDDFACAEVWVADGLAWRGIRVGAVVVSEIRVGETPFPDADTTKETALSRLE